LSNGKIKNYSQLGVRRTDIVLKTSYQSDFNEIKNSLIDFTSNHESILQEPKPEVLINELSETSIVFTVKVWTKNKDFTQVNSDILEFSKSVVKL
jgi:small conductance mechanosensitive channel